MARTISIDHARIRAFCRKHEIHRLALFGSVLRDDFGPDSDVDVLVEFEPDVRVGFIRLGAMEVELSEILGRRADLRTAAELSRYFREDVLAHAEVVHAGA